jgi:hypothetical protein
VLSVLLWARNPIGLHCRTRQRAFRPRRQNTFGKTEIAVPRARVLGEDGKTCEWKSKSLRAYQRRAEVADALIAGAYIAGTNTRRARGRTFVAIGVGTHDSAYDGRKYRRSRQGEVRSVQS